jgi:transposase
VPIPHDATLYRQRHRIEIMFGRLKDWRRIAMRYDRCAHTFLRTHLLQRHRPRRHRHLLARSMSPEPSSLSDLGLRCTHDADNTVWCNTKFHDAAATNTTSPIVT